MELFLILLIVFVAFMVPKLVDAHLLRMKVAKVKLAANELKERLAREMRERRQARRRK